MTKSHPLHAIRAPYVSRIGGKKQLGGFSIAGLFGTPPAPAPAPNLNPSPNATNPNPLPGVDPNNPTVPSPSPAPAPNTNPEPSPFEAFKDIWQTPDNTDPNASQAIFSNLDPKKLMESARQVDFTKTIAPESLQKIQAGGPEAVAAFAQAMNNVAQTVYAQSAVATTKIVEQALGKAQERIDNQLPSMVTRLTANQNLVAENPLIRNPAISPIVEALQMKLQMKNPNATPAELNQQVNAYLGELAKSFGPKPVATETKPGEVDWSTFL